MKTKSQTSILKEQIKVLEERIVHFKKAMGDRFEEEEKWRRELAHEKELRALERSFRDFAVEMCRMVPVVVNESDMLK